jgi:protein gp37
VAENSKIEWCTHTFNPWRGCTKVSDGCKFCYAETLSGRNHKTLGTWGPKGERVIAAESYWKQPYKWDKEAAATGERRRVFCASLADVFEGPQTMPEASRRPVSAARLRLFRTIFETPNLDWLLLTKRPENFLNILAIAVNQAWGIPTVENPFAVWLENWLLEYGSPHALGKGTPKNVWIGTSVEDQATANERIPYLLKIPVVVRFLSCEPLLGPVRLDHMDVDATYDWCQINALTGKQTDTGRPCADVPKISWVICGGESGPNARPMHPDWARSLRDQCESAGVPFLFKQWGEFVPTEVASNREVEQDHVFRVAIGDLDFRSDGVVTGRVSDVTETTNPARDGRPVGVSYVHYIERDDRLGIEQTIRRVGKKAAGRLLDGRLHDGYPEFSA